jgi:hypothetical protein
MRQPLEVSDYSPEIPIVPELILEWRKILNVLD